MSKYAEEILVEDLEIRDTNMHKSSPNDGYVAGVTPKNVLVVNKLDQAIDISVCGLMKDFKNTEEFLINSVPITVPAGENKAIALSEGYSRICVGMQCAVAPASGEISVGLMKVGVDG
jgi:hypothetical protein